MASHLNRPPRSRCFFCARCGEPFDFLELLNQELHPEPGRSTDSRNLFLEGVGCPACDWGTIPRFVLPNRACWDALLCAAHNITRHRFDGDVMDAKKAALFADVLFHHCVPEYISFFFGLEKVDGEDFAWDWLFGNSFQHRWRTLAEFARGGAFTIAQREYGRILLTRPVDADRSLLPDLPTERLNQAKDAVYRFVEQGSCLLSVLNDRMQALGFREDETRCALDAIARERLLYVRQFEHPVLKGGVLVSFRSES